MICIRCGSDVPDQSPQCPNCGQRFAGKKRTFTATTTSFRALEKRRLRTQKASDSLPYAVGEVVDDRYEVRDVLGQGPLGVVYRVFDQEIEVDVALKVMHDEVLPEDRLDAFDRVVKRVRRLSQQNIVRLYDTGGDTARLFTMQLLEGLTLRKVMGLRQDKGQRFTAREAEPILSQVTMALGHAHRHLVHGGLTPENVVILPDVVKLTDFGLYEAIGAAKFVEAQGSVDRARYLAPELLTADAIDLRADIYSLGVLLYELVSGVPFGPESGSIQQVLSAAGVPAIPDGLDAIVARATAEDPEARYESAEAFAEALGIYIDGEEIAAGAPARGGVPLLPEDVTRKVRIPAELRDPEGDEAGVSIDEVSIEIVLDSPPEEAEQSYAEALSDDELDGLIESTESIDHRAAVPVVPPPTPAAKPAGPPPSPVATGAGVVGLVAPPEVAFAEPAPDPRSPAAADAPAGPWFVRSNTGFIVAVALVVGLVALVAFWLMARESSPQSPASTGPVAVADRPAPAAVAPTVVPVSAVPASVVATPSAATATPDAGAPTDASAPTSVAALVAKGPAAQPGSAALGAVVSAGQVAKAPTSASTPVEPPKPVAPKPVEPPKAVAPKPVEPPKAVAPKPVEPPKPVAPKPVEPPKPVAPKPVEPPKPVAPKPVEPPKPATPKPVEPPAPPVQVSSEAAKGGAELRCRPGMRLVTTAKFPTGAVKRGTIKGLEAVALARSGGAYCIDSHEFPGRGRAPRTSVTFNAAEGLCKGQGKRLCSDKEWLRACGGSYPYGRSFNPAKCNTEDADGEERSIAVGGKFKGCKSAVGAYDMSGNVAEWTADQTVRGGDFTSADEDAACRAGGRRAASSSRGSIGFRCCSDFK